MTRKGKTRQRRGSAPQTLPKQNAARPDRAEPNPSDPNPPTIESLRDALAQKLEAFVMETQLDDCPRMACHRRHACTRENACESRQHIRKETPEQWARAMAALKRELERRVASARTPAN